MPTTNLIPSILRRGRSPEPGALTIFDILAAFPARSTLLQLLSAYDCAKLDAALGGVLDADERNKYIDYARDLFWHHSDFQCLLKHGLKLLVLGKDASVLKSRLRRPKYNASSKRRLRIFVVGLFPLREQSTELVHKALGVSIEPEPSMLRILQDGCEWEMMRIQSEDDVFDVNRYFILSFAAPMESSTHGAWYNVSRCPDVSVDLHVYVPCYRDRWHAIVTLPLFAIAHLSRGTRPSRVLVPVVAALKAYFGGLRARDLGYHRDFWRRAEDDLVLPVGTILLELTPFHNYMEVLY